MSSFFTQAIFPTLPRHSTVSRSFSTNFFIDASSHLYLRVCPSVLPSVHPSVHNQFSFISNFHYTFLNNTSKIPKRTINATCYPPPPPPPPPSPPPHLHYQDGSLFLLELVLLLFVFPCCPFRSFVPVEKNRYLHFRHKKILK